MKRPGRKLPSAHLRLFLVLAVDEKGTWRARDLPAFDHVDAVDRYQLKTRYTPVGVALLGGSGHPVKWLGHAPVIR